MKPEERAKKLVGDMPWITEKFAPAVIDDMRKQIETCLWVAIADEREACIQDVANERVDAEATGAAEDEAHNRALEDAIAAIRKRGA